MAGSSAAHVSHGTQQVRALRVYAYALFLMRKAIWAAPLQAKGAHSSQLEFGNY